MCCIITVVSVICSVVGQDVAVMTAHLVCLTTMHTVTAFSNSMCGSNSKSNLSSLPLKYCTFRLLLKPTQSAQLGWHTPDMLSVRVHLTRACLTRYRTTHCVAP